MGRDCTLFFLWASSRGLGDEFRGFWVEVDIWVKFTCVLGVLVAHAGVFRSLFLYFLLKF